MAQSASRIRTPAEIQWLKFLQWPIAQLRAVSRAELVELLVAAHHDVERFPAQHYTMRERIQFCRR